MVAGLRDKAQELKIRGCSWARRRSQLITLIEEHLNSRPTWEPTLDPPPAPKLLKPKEVK